MRNASLLLIVAVIPLLPTAPAPAQHTGRDRVLKPDAVELIDRQKEIEGKVDFQHHHRQYTYLFCSTANRDTFKANPA